MDKHHDVESFYHNLKKNSRFQCKIEMRQDRLAFFNQSQQEYLSVEYRDILGSRIFEKKRLILYVYEKSKKKKANRIRTTIPLSLNSTKECGDDDDKEEEEEEERLKAWQIKLNSMCTSLLLNKEDMDISVFDKPFLVFVNPMSGKGKALKLFQKYVTPMWNDEYSFQAQTFKLILTSK